MEKVKLGPQTLLYPMPAVLVGSKVAEKPNFMTLAWLTRVNMKPTMWGITMNKKHYTAVGIKQNNSFSINIPKAEMIEKTDFCGIISGRK